MLRLLKNIAHYLLALIAIIFYKYPAKNLIVIGVTGTDGKTTTSTIIYHLLKSQQKKVALISTVAAYIGEEVIDTGFHVTSPSPFSLQKLIRRIKNAGYEYLVLECTSHGLDQHRLLGTNIKYVVVTNITHEHLDYHQTYHKYLVAKAKIFKNAQIVALNKDDDSFTPLTPYLKTGTKLLIYDHKDIELYPAVSKRFNETYNQLNAIAAIKITTSLGLDAEKASQDLDSFPGILGRMQEIDNHLGIRIIIDFAHTPNGLKNALESLRKTTPGKLIAVYGAAGRRDATKRPVMGKIGSELAHEVVLTAEDPRDENVNTIIRQIKEGVTTNHGHIHSIIDRKQAIAFAINTLATNGDTVAIFGKGHEQSLNLDGKKEIPYSDQNAVAEILKEVT